MPTNRQTRNTLPGHRKIEVDDEEYRFLMGQFGPGRINKKTGLRSFAPPNVYDDPNKLSAGDTSVADANALAHQNAIDSAGGAPSVNVTNPLADPGSTTQNFAGPSSTTKLDDPVEKLQKKVMGAAGDIMDKPYEAYTGERFEGPSVDTTTSFADVKKMQGTGQTAYGEAAGVGKGVSGYTPEQVGAESFLGGKGVDQYMSPHTKNVIGGMQQQAMRTMQKQRGALQAQHQMAGAGMGSRGALENAAMMGEVQRGLGRQVAGALEGSYAQAAGMKKSDMERKQEADRYNQMAGLAGEDVKLRGAGMQIAGTVHRKVINRGIRILLMMNFLKAGIGISQT